VAGCVIEGVGRDEADVDDIGSLAGRSLDERAGERVRRQTHIPPHDDSRSAGKRHKRRPDSIGDDLVDLVGICASYVISLEYRGQIHDPGSL
jgi:hypothetical protein